MASVTGTTAFDLETGGADGSATSPAGETSGKAGTAVRQEPAGAGARRRRNPADRIARRALRVPDPDDAADVHNIFSSSIMLSATRCLLSYIVFPIIAPSVGVLPVIGPAIGIPVGLVALVFDVRAIRRFFLADHRWRWVATALYVTVMAMVSYLVWRDISRLL